MVLYTDKNYMKVNWFDIFYIWTRDFIFRSTTYREEKSNNWVLLGNSKIQLVLLVILKNVLLIVMVLKSQSFGKLFY